MRALSFWQPHGSLLTTGAKRFETRARPTKVRGEILLHAAAHCVRREMEYFLQNPDYRAGLAPLVNQPLSFLLPTLTIPIEAIPFGAFIGIGELVNCKRCEDMTPEEKTEARCFGDFRPGRFAWEFRNVRRFAKPIPAKGHQGFWFDHIEQEDKIFIGLPRRIGSTNSGSTSPT